MTPPDGASPARDVSEVPFKPLPMKGPDVSVDYRPDGSLVITSNHAPGAGPRSIAHLLAQKAGEHPDRPYIKQREPGHGPWRGVTYGQALRAVEGIAQWLIDRKLGPDDSVMILSGNSIEHALMTLGAYTAGVPAAPISPAYSLISTDHAKLRHCFDKVAPRVVFAQSGALFDKALATLKALDPTIQVVTADGMGDGAIAFADVAGTVPTNAVAAMRETLGPATVAKYLFTSGSTGMPKAVPQTHGMMAGVIAGQDGIKLEEPDTGEVPQSLEWMPWSHISAGNIGFNGLLWAGGTLHIDEGKPLPGIQLKLAPSGSKFEVRVKGPTVASGYHKDPERTAAAFDEEGFYRLGDAARFVDPDDPAKGLVFDGRVTEDFKLDSGTWVSVGVLRPDLVAACSPYIHDAVICGQDKGFIGALFWPSPAGLMALVADPGPGKPMEKLVAFLKERLAAFNATAGGSSRRIGRFTVMTEPPSIDAGEITDKGYVNQRATLERRAALVEALYAKEPGEGVVTV